MRRALIEMEVKAGGMTEGLCPASITAAFPWHIMLIILNDHV